MCWDGIFLFSTLFRQGSASDQRPTLPISSPTARCPRSRRRLRRRSGRRRPGRGPAGRWAPPPAACALTSSPPPSNAPAARIDPQAACVCCPFPKRKKPKSGKFLDGCSISIRDVRPSASRVAVSGVSATFHTPPISTRPRARRCHRIRRPPSRVPPLLPGGGRGPRPSSPPSPPPSARAGPRGGRWRRSWAAAPSPATSVAPTAALPPMGAIGQPRAVRTIPRSISAPSHSSGPRHSRASQISNPHRTERVLPPPPPIPAPRPGPMPPPGIPRSAMHRGPTRDPTPPRCAVVPDNGFAQKINPTINRP